MQPLFTSACPKTTCGHPAIRASKQCKRAMELVNASRLDEAEALLRSALSTLRAANIPMMQAKILNSLGLIYQQQHRMTRATRCFDRSMTIVAKTIGTNNWLYGRIADNKNQLAA